MAAFIDEYNTDRRHSTNGMLSPDRLRTRLRNATCHRAEHQEHNGRDGRHEPGGDGFAAAVPPAERRGRMRGRPSGLKGASAIAAHGPAGPPLTPEPLRPLNAQPARAGARPLPAGRAALEPRQSRSNPYKPSLYGFRGLPPGMSGDAACGQFLSEDLLPGWSDEWLVVERERYRQLRLHALDKLCLLHAEAGRFALAIIAGLASVSSDPTRESAHRALMRAHLLEGNPSEAVRQYHMLYAAWLAPSWASEHPHNWRDLLLDALNGGPEWGQVVVYAEVGGHPGRCNAAITLR